MTGNEISLDTSAVVKLLNNQALADSILAPFDRECLPAVAVGEMLFGASNSQRKIDNLRRYRLFIDRCVVLEVNVETAEIYADLRLTLKQRGQPIPDSDIWIAASSIQYSLPLLTVDAHFSHIPRLNIYPAHWS